MEPSALSRIERLQGCLEGKLPDRPPVALWRHFPVDDQSPGSLAAATIAFQQLFDFDFIKVTPSSSYCLRDWGATDEWQGNPEGTRQYQERVIQHPADWRRLPILDPGRGSLNDQITCLNLLASHYSGRVPLVMTIFNPLSQARNLAGADRLLAHLRQYPEDVLIGLETITRSTLAFLERCLQTGISGIFLAVQHAQAGILTEPEYRHFGRPFDLLILSHVQDLWLNFLHIHGEEIYFDMFMDYPIQVVNWHDQKTPPTLAEGQQKFPGALCGGLRQWETMVLGSPDRVTAEARAALAATACKRFILGTGCVTPITAPYGNLMAARRAVESYQGS